MSLSEELRKVAEMMGGWNYQHLLVDAADTIDRQARVMRELLTDRDAEIARLRREIGDMTQRWHDAQRNQRSPQPFDWHAEVKDR